MKKIAEIKKLKKELMKEKYGRVINHKTIIYILEDISGNKVDYETVKIQRKKFPADTTYLNADILYNMNLSEMPYNIKIIKNDYGLSCDILDEKFFVQRDEDERIYNNYECYPEEYIHLKEYNLYIRKTTTGCDIFRSSFIKCLDHILRMLEFENSFYSENKGKTKTLEEKYNEEKIYNNGFMNIVHMIANNKFIQFILLVILINISNVIGGAIWFIGLIVLNRIDKKYYINEFDDSYINEDVFNENILCWIARVHKDIPFDININIETYLKDDKVDESLKIYLNNLLISIKNNKFSDSISDEDKIKIQNAIDEHLTRQEVEAQFAIKL